METELGYIRLGDTGEANEQQVLEQAQAQAQA